MRGRLAAVALVAALAVAAAAGAATPQATLVEAGARFPDRSYVLTLDRKRLLDPAQVSVTENGKPVDGLSLVAAGASKPKQFAVVLAIDASNSMRGRPIAAAMAAARAFAAHRGPNQELAVLAFNGGIHVLQPFTTDAAKIRAVLARTPRLAEGTRLYDGLGRAEELSAGARVAAASIVLLSDGSDVGSVTRPDAALSRLAAQHVRAFTVGLASKTFDPAALAEIASASGGTYAEALNAEALTPIFDQLGNRLANEYLLGYRSLEGPGRRVDVRVRISGLPELASTYESPKLELTAAPPYRRSLADRVLQSPAAMLAVALGVAALFGGALAALLRPRRGTLLKRMSAFVSVAAPEAAAAHGGVSDEVLERTEQSLSRFGWWDRLEESLGLAEVRLSAAQVVALTAIGSLVVALFFVLLLGPLGFLLGAVVPFAVRGAILTRVARRRRRFGEQLPDNLEVLASALRAGHSLVGALAVVVENAPEPSKGEFRRVLAEEQLGVELEDALAVVVRRMDSRDLDQVALVARLQRETGSNSAEVLDRVVETVRARIELRRLVRTLTAQGRLSRWVLTAVPVFMALILSLLDPGYLSPLYHHGSGRFLLVVAVLMVTAGSLVIRKIIDIKV